MATYSAQTPSLDFPAIRPLTTITITVLTETTLNLPSIRPTTTIAVFLTPSILNVNPAAILTKQGLFYYLGQSAAPSGSPTPSVRPLTGQLWPRGINSHG